MTGIGSRPGMRPGARPGERQSTAPVSGTQPLLPAEQRIFDMIREDMPGVHEALMHRPQLAEEILRERVAPLFPDADEANAQIDRIKRIWNKYHAYLDRSGVPAVAAAANNLAVTPNNSTAARANVAAPLAPAPEEGVDEMIPAITAAVVSVGSGAATVEVARARIVSAEEKAVRKFNRASGKLEALLRELAEDAPADDSEPDFVEMNDSQLASTIVDISRLRDVTNLTRHMMILLTILASVGEARRAGVDVKGVLARLRRVARFNVEVDAPLDMIQIRGGRLFMDRSLSILFNDLYMSTVARQFIFPEFLREIRNRDFFEQANIMMMLYRSGVNRYLDMRSMVSRIFVGVQAQRAQLLAIKELTRPSGPRVTMVPGNGGNDPNNNGSGNFYSSFMRDIGRFTDNLGEIMEMFDAHRSNAENYSSFERLGTWGKIAYVGINLMQIAQQFTGVYNEISARGREVARFKERLQRARDLYNGVEAEAAMQTTEIIANVLARHEAAAGAAANAAERGARISDFRTQQNALKAEREREPELRAANLAERGARISDFRLKQGLREAAEAEAEGRAANAARREAFRAGPAADFKAEQAKRASAAHARFEVATAAATSRVAERNASAAAATSAAANVRFDELVRARVFDLDNRAAKLSAASATMAPAATADGIAKGVAAAEAGRDDVRVRICGAAERPFLFGFCATEEKTPAVLKFFERKLNAAEEQPATIFRTSATKVRMADAAAHDILTVRGREFQAGYGVFDGAVAHAAEVGATAGAALGGAGIAPGAAFVPPISDAVAAQGTIIEGLRAYGAAVDAAEAAGATARNTQTAFGQSADVISTLYYFETPADVRAAMSRPAPEILGEHYDRVNNGAHRTTIRLGFEALEATLRVGVALGAPYAPPPIEEMSRPRTRPSNRGIEGLPRFHAPPGHRTGDPLARAMGAEKGNVFKKAVSGGALKKTRKAGSKRRVTRKQRGGDMIETVVKMYESNTPYERIHLLADASETFKDLIKKLI
jgi:hypothetical protein